MKSPLPSSYATQQHRGGGMKLAGDQGLVIPFFLLCYASGGILVPASASATAGNKFRPA